MTAFVDVDVRPVLRAGGEPFEKIMAAVKDRVTSPPKRKSAVKASSVVNDVCVVRDSVWFIAASSNWGSGIFLYRRKSSRMRS